MNSVGVFLTDSDQMFKKKGASKGEVELAVCPEDRSPPGATILQ